MVRMVRMVRSLADRTFQLWQEQPVAFQVSLLLLPEPRVGLRVHPRGFLARGLTKAFELSQGVGRLAAGIRPRELLQPRRRRLS